MARGRREYGGRRGEERKGEGGGKKKENSSERDAPSSQRSESASSTRHHHHHDSICTIALIVPFHPSSFRLTREDQQDPSFAHTWSLEP